jgi:hypothetical protein
MITGEVELAEGSVIVEPAVTLSGAVTTTARLNKLDVWELLDMTRHSSWMPV